MGKAEEEFVEYSFQVHIGELIGQSVHLTGLWGKGFCVCCLCVLLG